MSASKRITCRTHGGYFTVAPRRGRPPVKCTEDNQCTAVNTAINERKPTRRQMVEERAQYEAADKAKRTAAKKPVDVTSNRAQLAASVEKAKVAKEQLTIQGWNVTGRAWSNSSSDHYAEITASRGEELLHMVWFNGEITTSNYSLWSTEQPSTNGKPESNLPFDPNEITDSELARYLVGVQVTWFNRLKQGTETAICGKDSIKIEHNFNSTGDEMPEDRIIKFVDAEGHGFQAFRLGALLKVGKK